MKGLREKDYSTPTHTPWRIIDFARRYDGWADWVQDEQNKLAVKNANIGKQTLHKRYDEVDFFSPPIPSGQVVIQLMY